MKTLFLFISSVIFSLGVKAQEEKVEIIQNLFLNTNNEATVDGPFLLTCNIQSVVVQSVSSDYFLPFKLYDFVSTQENWYAIQSVYNTLQATVPGVSITTSSGLNPAPNIRMRGDDNTIVIVDGIRHDASILSTINPSDIESITVAPNAGASNYLINN